MVPFVQLAIAKKFARHALSGTNVLNWRTKVWVVNSKWEKRKKWVRRVFPDTIKEMNTWSCEDLEERSSRPRSGCRKNSKCEGCMHCVCFGCKMCRFEDCRCQVCVDFYSNAIYKLKLKKNVSNILKMKFQKQKNKSYLTLPTQF
ncbi:putative developmental regulator, ULTRAPETALA [Helianthus annuus]|uniref:Developmental regulator, ULTRAPETALA n=1 Tax=Helianthus annuus TaxID=4232 RepID=A0A9K3J1T8_HELAN|nr:putative developmental regulator, ULTRAPETALA [Helianthus annuus]